MDRVDRNTTEFEILAEFQHLWFLRSSRRVPIIRMVRNADYASPTFNFAMAFFERVKHNLRAL
jgi:hypothetical protein